MVAIQASSRRKRHGSALAFGLMIGAAATTAPRAQDANVGELTVRATGFTDARGHAIAKLFIPGDNVLRQGRWQIVAPIDGRAAEFHFRALPAGRYAVVVFHDENDNGVIDHGLLGPSEPIGFSGGFALSLTSGIPNFERLQFMFKPPAQTLEMSVR